MLSSVPRINFIEAGAIHFSFLEEQRHKMALAYKLWIMSAIGRSLKIYKIKTFNQIR